MPKRGITQKSNEAERLNKNVEKNNSDVDAQTIAILVYYLNQDTTRCIFFKLPIKAKLRFTHPVA